MDKAIIAFIGVIVGGLFQAFLFWLKYRAEAKDKIRERQVLFAAALAQYLQYVRDIEYAEQDNQEKGEPVPLSSEQRADLSSRHRAVIGSMYSLMACGDSNLAVKAKSFQTGFNEYVAKLRKITTGANGLPYESQEPVEKLAEEIQAHNPSLPLLIR